MESTVRVPQVRRGHLRWTDFRYQEALLDFEDAASLEDYGGAKSINSWGKKNLRVNFFWEFPLHEKPWPGWPG